MGADVGMGEVEGAVPNLSTQSASEVLPCGML